MSIKIRFSDLRATLVELETLRSLSTQLTSHKYDLRATLVGLDTLRSLCTHIIFIDYFLALKNRPVLQSRNFRVHHKFLFPFFRCLLSFFFFFFRSQ